MNQRVAEFLDDVAVEFGVFALEQQLNILPLLEGKVADEPGHFLKTGTDRHHPQRHGGPLQVGGDATQLAEASGEMAVGGRGHSSILHDH